MRRLKAGKNQTNWISKIRACPLFFISVLAISLVSGCVREATPHQLAVAKQQNILLGQGYSIAYYPVSLRQAMDAVPQVMAAHNGIFSREYIFITDNSRPKGQWLERRSNLQVQESGGAITAYMCRWLLSGKYYVVTVTSEQPATLGVKVEIDPVLAVWCAPSDYDTYVLLHQTFQEKLNVKCIPAPEGNTQKGGKPKSKI